MNILVINGPNLNMLGIREPEIYGRETYADLCRLIEEHAEKAGVTVTLCQSNHEGDLVDAIQLALGKQDALKAVAIPAVEVHISDPDTREDFRKVSYVRAACIKTIKGRGFDGYLEAIDFLAGGCR